MTAPFKHGPLPPAPSRGTSVPVDWTNECDYHPDPNWDRRPIPAPRVAEIQRAVAEHFGTRPLDMIADRRGREVARPRQMAMYLACELTTQSLPQIGRAFRRDHTTVRYAHKMVALRAASDPALARAIEVLTQSLTDDPRAARDLGTPRRLSFT